MNFSQEVRYNNLTFASEFNLRLIENKSEYAFFKERQYFKTGYFRLSYFFGNNKVKTISKKQDDINERIN